MNTLLSVVYILCGCVSTSYCLLFLVEYITKSKIDSFDKFALAMTLSCIGTGVITALTA